MDFEARGILRSAIGSYLQAEHPNKVDEFELVFDDVYETVKDQIDALPHSDEELRSPGIAFDVSSIADPVISLSIVVGAVLLKAAAKVVIKDDLPPLFDKLEASLKAVFKRPDVVARVRHRIQRVLEEV